MTTEFKLNLRVYYEDTDAGGVVYHANYLKFMERARTEFLRRLGYSQQQLAQTGVLFVVHSNSTKYLAPERLDDELSISARVSLLKRSRLEFSQQVCKTTDGTLLCQADFVIACINSNTFKPCAMPKELFAAMTHQLTLP